LRSSLDYTAKAKEHLLNVMLSDPITFEQSANRLLKQLTSADVDKSFSGAFDSFLSAVMYRKQEGVQPSSTYNAGRMTFP
jgi:hypothetical protein